MDDVAISKLKSPLHLYATMICQRYDMLTQKRYAINKKKTQLVLLRIE